MRRVDRIALLGAAVVVVTLVAASTVLADTLRVETTKESGPGSLGAAILEAGDGDTIKLGPGEYLLTNGEYLVAKGLTLEGAGPDATTIVPSGGGDALTDDAVTVVDASTASARQVDGGGDEASIETKAQIIALVATLAIFLVVLDLVRRRRLAERYALLWMFAAVALLVLAIWTDGLEVIADAMGIEEPANAIFILAFGVIFGLLLNFSVATSRLSEETKILAQEVARLDHELRAARGELPSGNGTSAAAGAEQGERERPVGPQPGPQ